MHPIFTMNLRNGAWIAVTRDKVGAAASLVDLKLRDGFPSSPCVIAARAASEPTIRAAQSEHGAAHIFAGIIVLHCDLVKGAAPRFAKDPTWAFTAGADGRRPSGSHFLVVCLFVRLYRRSLWRKYVYSCLTRKIGRTIICSALNTLERECCEK